MNANVWKVVLQQDNYVVYAESIRTGTLKQIEDSDKRLFPGYPLAMLAVNTVVPDLVTAGLVISVLSTVWTAVMLLKICSSKIPAYLSIFFPPVWMKLGAKIATEPFFTAISISSIYLFIHKKYLGAGLLAGLAMMVRPVGVMLFLAYGIILIKQKSLALKVAAGFAMTASLLLIFNGITFGWGNMLEQFMHGERYGLRFGVVQMAQDIWRTWNWGQYRILASGIFYMAVNAVALCYLWKNYHKSGLTALMAVWMTLTLGYILAFSPVTLIDDFGRYTVACLPALLIGWGGFLEKMQPDGKHVPGKTPADDVVL